MSQDTEQDIDTTTASESNAETEATTGGDVAPTLVQDITTTQEEPTVVESPTPEDAPELILPPPVVPIVPKDVLRALLNRRNVAQVGEAQWAEAVAAVAAGKVVRVTTSPPFLKVTDEPFTPGSKATTGIDVLNNLVRGML